MDHGVGATDVVCSEVNRRVCAMAQPDKAALVNYLTLAMQTLHAEDQRLRSVLLDVQRNRVVGPVEFEALIDAQQTALRIPASALLMLAGYVEEHGLGELAGHEHIGAEAGTRPKPPPVAVSTRLKRALRAFFLED